MFSYSICVESFDPSEVPPPKSPDTSGATVHYSSLIASFSHDQEEAVLPHMFQWTHAIPPLLHMAVIDF